MSLKWVCLSVLFTSVVISLNVHAVSFKVHPLSIAFDKRTKSSIVTITNTHSGPVTVQLESKRWYQDHEGADKYEDTKDVIFFPKIITIEKGEQRIVRVGFRGKPTQQMEQSYRLYFQELPDSRPAAGALSFAIRFGVPVFVKVANPKYGFDIGDSFVKNAQLNVNVVNVGNTHIIAKNIAAQGFSRNERSTFEKDMAGWYVLPGMTRTFSLDLPEESCASSRQINIQVSVGTQVKHSKISADTASCVALKTK